jgi:predicted alpha/beta-fold hydrolase
MSFLYYNFFKFLFPFLLIILAYIFNFINLIIITTTYLFYCAYHFTNSTTILIFKKNKKNLKIVGISKIDEEHFKPYFFLPSAFLQIVFLELMTGPPEELNIERREVNGCGTYLDWINIREKGAHSLTNDNNNSDSTPILLLLPGAQGRGNDKYYMNCAYEGLKNNYKVAVFINRLTSEKLILSEESHLNLFDDLDLAIDQIKMQYPKSKIYAVGFSYGGNKIVHYLGSKNNLNKKIDGAVSISNPYDFILFQRYLSDSIYDYFVLKELKFNLQRLKPRLSQPNSLVSLDIESAEKCSTVKEFDEFITRRILGYKTSDDHFRGISCVHHMTKINVPLLCISSLDDNITTAKAIPYDEISQNENIILLQTDYGGHCSFIGNQDITKFKLVQWVNKPIIQFLNTIRSLEG